MTREQINNLKLEVLKVVVNRPNSTANMSTIIEHTKEILDKVFDINDTINFGKDIVPTFFNPGFDTFNYQPLDEHSLTRIHLDYQNILENRKRIIENE